MNLNNVVAVRNIKTVYRDGDKAIKVFNEDYSKADVLNEALNQARVEETGLDIPRILEVTKLDGKWAIVSDFIEGKTMSQIMQEEPERMNELLEQFVGIQLHIHEQRAPLLTKLKDKMNRKISETSLDATTRYELHTRWRACPSTTRCVTGILTPAISSSLRRASPM